MQRINSKFQFTKEYQKPLNDKGTAFVSLEIDYVKCTYSITPTTTNQKGFMFSENSSEYRMWLAVLDCIKEAIEFANKELGLDENPLTKFA